MTTFTISAGHTSGYTVNSGDTLDVLSGGTSSASMVNSGGSATIAFGGSGSGDVILSSGTAEVFGVATSEGISGGFAGGYIHAVLEVESGGMVTHDILGLAGVEDVHSGGSAVSTTVNQDGTQDVSGGMTTGTVVQNQGLQSVEAGGSAVGTTVDDSFLVVSSGGTAIGAVVGDSGMEGVYASGATSGGVVSNFGALFVNQGGSASGTTVDATGSAYVFSGGTAISVTMSGGTMQVSGGTTFSTTVSSGGSEFVYSGGVASAATVSSGGTEDVSSGGKTSGAMVLSSGTETVLSGGSAFSTTLSGGTENVSSGGTATGGKVTSGGELLVSSAGSATGVTVSSAGLTAVFSGGTASDTTIAAGGKLQMLAGGSATGFVTFAGSGGLFAVGGTVMPTATISGFVSGDTIDLTGLTWSAGGTVSLSSSTAGELLVNEGGGTYDLQLDPDHSYAGETFSATQDFATGAGTGSDITVTCFAPGTLIATPGGAVAVETLRAGDLVLTADGARMPVRWLGVQTVATRFADPLLMLPIRIRAGALGENLPGRDLLLSPGHAVLLENLLVQAGALVNGTSIVRETDVPERLRYYHVELDSHALLLAEGVAAESFLDGVEAMQFDNAHTRTACEIPAELPYPRIKSHRQVPRALRERLSRATPPVGGPLAA